MTERNHVYRVFVSDGYETELIDFLESRGIPHTYEFTEEDTGR